MHRKRENDLLQGACWNIIQRNLHHIFSNDIIVIEIAMTSSLPSCCFWRITYLKAPHRAETNYAKWENNANDCDKCWWEWYLVFIRIHQQLHTDITDIIVSTISNARTEQN